MGIASPESFGPELFELLRVASQERVTLVFPSNTKARHHRHRLYQLRASLRAKDHPLRPLADQVQFRLIEDEPPGGATIIAQPADEELSRIIRAAGIKPSTPDDPLPAPRRPTDDLSGASLIDHGIPTAGTPGIADSDALDPADARQARHDSYLADYTGELEQEDSNQNEESD